MRIKFNRSKLQRAWGLVSGAVPARSPKEVLRSVLLEADGNEVRLYATDLEVGVVASIGEIDGDGRAGKVLLPNRFGPIISEATGETVEILVGDAGIEVRTDQASFKLPTGNPDEFPRTEVTMAPQVTLEAADYLRAVSATVWAIDEANSRFALGGVLWTTDAGKVVAVATDGRRLSYCATGGDAAAMPETVLPVPPRVLQLTRKVSGPVGLYFGENTFAVRSSVDGGSFDVWGRLIEGRYPKWQSVREQVSGDAATINRETFLSVVRQAAICSDLESRGVDLSFVDGVLGCRAATADVGRADVTTAFEGPDLASVLVDSRYLIQWLGAVDADTVEMRVRAANAPIGLAAGPASYTLMPMSVE
jgi:DNA polymerase-3 subunit beta